VPDPEGFCHRGSAQIQIDEGDDAPAAERGDRESDFPAEAGCSSPLDATETSACGNGLDDDGLVDTADPACSSGNPAVPDPTALSEKTECQDGLENDGDGRIDFDGGQSSYGACSGGVCPSGVSDVDSDGVAGPDPQCVNRS
jgi:hypothetical protein